MNTIEVSDLKKSFRQGKKSVAAVKGISFTVKKGEILGLLGPNGAGKTTTINMLTGLVEKDEGSIRLLGKDPDKDWEYVKNRINVATAYEKLTDVLTVSQNLNVYALLYGVNNRKQRIAKLAHDFNLAGILDRKISKLSSGQNTRVMLAKALLNNPEIIFLDECTVGLDPDIAERTRQMIREYNKKTQCTIIFTSHYMYEVEELCHRIIFMQDGKIIKIGSAADIKGSITSTTVELIVDKPKELKSLLDKHAISMIPLANNMVRFDIDTNKHHLQTLLKAISAKNIKFDNLHLYKPTLEDVFIKLARK